MIFVDTSFFFALFAKEDGNHLRARAAFEAREGQRLPELLVTTDHVVFETITLTRTSFERHGHDVRRRGGRDRRGHATSERRDTSQPVSFVAVRARRALGRRRAAGRGKMESKGTP